jgi:hypothetical protein
LIDGAGHIKAAFGLLFLWPVLVVGRDAGSGHVLEPCILKLVTTNPKQDFLYQYVKKREITLDLTT